MSESRKDLEQKIIERAMKDEAFRNKITGSPKEAIEKEMGVKLPENLNIHVSEEGPNDIYISLPVISDELSEEQLSGVAGGWNPGCKDSNVDF